MVAVAVGNRPAIVFRSHQPFPTTELPVVNCRLGWVNHHRSLNFKFELSGAGQLGLSEGISYFVVRYSCELSFAAHKPIHWLECEVLDKG